MFALLFQPIFSSLSVSVVIFLKAMSDVLGNGN